MIFLCQLQEQPPMSKVRFLGCVLDYEDATGYVTVEHRYQINSSRPRSFTAQIDMNIVLGTAKPECFQSGSWINIIGYVQEPPNRKSQKSKASRSRSAVPGLPVVQAVLVWSAGALKVDKYERAIEQYLAQESAA